MYSVESLAGEAFPNQMEIMLKRLELISANGLAVWI